MRGALVAWLTALRCRVATRVLPNLVPGIRTAHRPPGPLSCELQPRPRRAHLPRLRSLRPRRIPPPRPVTRRSQIPPRLRPTVPACLRTGRLNPDPSLSLGWKQYRTFAFLHRVACSCEYVMHVTRQCPHSRSFTLRRRSGVPTPWLPDRSGG